MMGAFKTITTVLTVASTAAFCKDMYSKYKGKKKERQIDEVHTFISALDLEALQKAIDSDDIDALIDAVENIIKAADVVKEKSELEELADEAQEAAEKLFKKFSSTASKVVAKVNEKLDEVQEFVNEMEVDESESSEICTYEDFMKRNGCLYVLDSHGNKFEIYVNTKNVFISDREKKVVFIAPSGEAIVAHLA